MSVQFNVALASAAVATTIATTIGVTQVKDDLTRNVSVAAGGAVGIGAFMGSMHGLDRAPALAGLESLKGTGWMGRGIVAGIGAGLVAGAAIGGIIIPNAVGRHAA